MIVTVIALGIVMVFSLAAAEGDLSSPLPSKEKAQKQGVKEVNLELTLPVPVTPGVEKEASGAITTPQSEEELEQMEEEGVPLESEKEVGAAEEKVGVGEKEKAAAIEKTKAAPPKGQ